MKFISYSQNLEDVMLWRALHNFGPGFYIDVGACEPIDDSVTKLFYENGWRGINIEPMKEPMQRLMKDRPRDINLNIAIEDKKSNKKYFSIDSGNGLSTSSEEYAHNYKNAQRNVTEVIVETSTLEEVCQNHVNGEIHFLKIDVEGSEPLVLAGADFKTFRPWIIVIESTIPNSQISTYHLWEHFLIQSDYSFIYFDGLNRYYLAKEKFDLLSGAFTTPPNWFDNFERYTECLLRSQIENHAITIKTLEDEIRQLKEKIIAWKSRSFAQKFYDFLTRKKIINEEA